MIIRLAQGHRAINATTDIAPGACMARHTPHEAWIVPATNIAHSSSFIGLPHCILQMKQNAAMASSEAGDTEWGGEQQQEQPLVGGLWIGCAGYSVSRTVQACIARSTTFSIKAPTQPQQYPHWRAGVFYPRGLKSEQELRHYSRVFDTCEGQYLRHQI